MRSIRTVIAACAAVCAFLCISCDSGNGGEGEPKDLDLTYPAGNETFKVGDKVTVTWKASNKISSVYFKISTHSDSGWNESMTAGSIPAEAGKWEWTVGDEYYPQKVGYPSTTCKLKILDYETLGATFRDSSDYFSVTR